MVEIKAAQYALLVRTATVPTVVTPLQFLNLDQAEAAYKEANEKDSGFLAIRLYRKGS